MSSLFLAVVASAARCTVECGDVLDETSADTPRYHERCRPITIMKLPTRQPINATERAGINYVRTIVEEANSVFHEIHRENDYGNDAFVELVDGDQVTGLSVALQVKSGASYCSRLKCTIPTTERQWNYWSKNRLPVAGIVYDPDETNAYWVSISHHVRASSSHQSIVFEKSELTRFDQINFTEIFVPFFADRPVLLSFDKSLRFARDASPQSHSIGIRSLFYEHRNKIQTWEALAELLRSRPAAHIDPFLAYLLAHVPGHGDIVWGAESIVDKDIRDQARTVMRSWGRDEVLQLLYLMDEYGVERGSIGQSVYAIVDQTVHNAAGLLRNIFEDKSIAADARRSAILLLCMIEQEHVEPVLQRHVDDVDVGPSVNMLLDHLRRVGFFSAS